MFKYLKNDLPASVVVFFVALPLCLGIALASNAPLFSGLIAGIVGGIVVGAISGSQIGVSGPAAGLAAIVFSAIDDLGFEVFLSAVVLAGVIQIIFGVAKLGIIAYFFPSSVIKGMLTGIGIIIILKQIPYFFGVDETPQTLIDYLQINPKSNFSGLFETINAFLTDSFNLGAIIIGIIALVILIMWSNILSKKAKIFELIQGPLVVVVVGIIFYVITQGGNLGIAEEHLVSLSKDRSTDNLLTQFTTPDWSKVFTTPVLLTAFTMALVASLETLLCVEATDKLDPEKRVTPTNRELLAQGAGNIVSGFIGGLPITQVIVRSSANIQSGGKTKSSAIIHGFFIIASVAAIPFLLQKIPLSVLAAVLFIVGFKLAKPATFKAMWKGGWKQFVPFIITILGIVFLDLLKGLALGLIVGILIVLYKSYKNSHFLHKQNDDPTDGKIKMTLAEEVTFFNKGAILKELDSIPENSYLEIDVRKTRYLDVDIIEILDDFAHKAKTRNIDIKIVSERGEVENPPSYIEFFKLRSKTE